MSADEYALIEFRLGDLCERQQCNHREIAVRRDTHWVGRDSGLSVADSQITSRTPLHLVSLDAAIEEAAKAFCRIHLGDVWDSITAPARDGYRDYFRDVLTAAVMGGAQ